MSKRNAIKYINKNYSIKVPVALCLTIGIFALGFIVGTYAKPSKRERMLHVGFDQSSSMCEIYTYILSDKGEHVYDGWYYYFYTDLSIAVKEKYIEGMLVDGDGYYLGARSQIPKDFFHHNPTSQLKQPPTSQP
jgi:hypothetical protein